MNHSLSVAPQQKTVDTGVQNARDVAESLGNALSDTYHLMFKSQAYHWNVEGPLFLSVHQLTETHYQDMFGAVDVLAERMRALGQLAPTNLKSIISASALDDPEICPTAGEMISDLAADHMTVARRLHDLARLAGDNNDVVTEDLAITRSAFHEQAAWMLRATAAH